MTEIRSIQFSSPTALSVYNRVMQKVETEKGKKRVDMVFEIVGCYDEDPAVNEEEAAAAELTLEDHNAVYWGRDAYDDSEIGEIFLDGQKNEFKEKLHSSLDDLSFLLLITALNSSKVIQSIYTIDSPHALKIREIYQDMSKTPGVGAKELMEYWKQINGFAASRDIYDPEKDELRADWDIAGINSIQVIDKYFFYELAIIAQAYFNKIDYDNRFQSFGNDWARAALDKNPKIRGKAIQNLGELQEGQETIIDGLYENAISWYDGFAPTQSTFSALLNFPNQRTLDVLEERIQNGDFTSLVFAEDTLVRLANVPEIVVLLTKWLRSKDPFLIAEAAFLYRYLWGKEDFAPFINEARDQLLDLALNDPDPLVQATAIETLGYGGEEEVLSFIKER